MPSAKSDLMVRALDLTENMLNSDPVFEDIATKLVVTPRSLSRRFADELGMTWRQALRQMRMIRANEALAQSDAPITGVAMDVGYSSLSAINAAFLEFTGQTPSKYCASFRP